MPAEFARPQDVSAATPAGLRLRARKGLLLALIALLAVALWAGSRAALHHYLAAGRARAEAALRLTANGLEADLARYEVVPQLIAELDLIRRLVSDPGNAVLQQAASVWLAGQNAALRASDIYVIRPDGDTIAASNHLDGLDSLGMTSAGVRGEEASWTEEDVSAVRMRSVVGS